MPHRCNAPRFAVRRAEVCSTPGISARSFPDTAGTYTGVIQPLSLDATGVSQVIFAMAMTMGTGQQGLGLILLHWQRVAELELLERQHRREFELRTMELDENTAGRMAA